MNHLASEVKKIFHKITFQLALTLWRVTQYNFVDAINRFFPIYSFHSSKFCSGYFFQKGCSVFSRTTSVAGGNYSMVGFIFIYCSYYNSDHRIIRVIIFLAADHIADDCRHSQSSVAKSANLFRAPMGSRQSDCIIAGHFFFWRRCSCTRSWIGHAGSVL